jgi:hypothetical protein
MITYEDKLFRTEDGSSVFLLNVVIEPNVCTKDSSGRVISPSQRPLPTQDNTTYRHNRQTSMPSSGFEPATPATKRPQTYALDRAATGICSVSHYHRGITKIYRLFVLYVCSKSVHNVTHRVRYKKGPSVIWVWCSIKETSGIIGSEKSRDGFSRSSRAWRSDTQGHCCQYLPVSKRSSLPFNIFWRLRTYWDTHNRTEFH